MTYYVELNLQGRENSRTSALISYTFVNFSCMTLLLFDLKKKKERESLLTFSDLWIGHP